MYRNNFLASFPIVPYTDGPIETETTRTKEVSMPDSTPSSPTDLGPDLPRYRSLVANMELTDDEADELLRTLYDIMRRFVELGLKISVPDIFDCLSDDFSAASPSSSTISVEEGVP
jgi:hypothetical protein